MGRDLILHHGCAQHGTYQLSGTACRTCCHDLIFLFVKLLLQKLDQFSRCAHRIAFCPNIFTGQNLVIFIYNNTFGRNRTYINTKICLFHLDNLLSHTYHVVKCFHTGLKSRITCL